MSSGFRVTVNVVDSPARKVETIVAFVLGLVGGACVGYVIGRRVSCRQK